MKQKGYIKPDSFPKLTQSSLLPFQMRGQSELAWVSVEKPTGFRGSYFVSDSVGDGGVVVVVCGEGLWVF